MRRHASHLALMLVALPALGSTQKPALAQPTRALSQDSLRRVGEELLQARVKEVGIETNPEWRRESLERGRQRDSAVNGSLLRTLAWTG
jgi:hypothetical protein